MSLLQVCPPEGGRYFWCMVDTPLFALVQYRIAVKIAAQLAVQRAGP